MKICIKNHSTSCMIIAAILSLLLIITSVLGLRSFNDEREATEKYILCEKAAQKLQKGSDVLTEQVRLFVLTGEARYMDGYFTEANVTKNRDTALEELSVYFADSSVFAALQEALGESRTLMEREFYAMRLVVDALDMNKDSVPQEVLSVEISEKDRGRTRGLRAEGHGDGQCPRLRESDKRQSREQKLRQQKQQ